MTTQSTQLSEPWHSNREVTALVATPTGRNHSCGLQPIVAFGGLRSVAEAEVGLDVVVTTNAIAGADYRWPLESATGEAHGRLVVHAWLGYD